MDISDRMKNRRKELGLTADEVAEKIGVSRSNVYRYEKGDIEKLPLEILEPLSKALKTSPQYLMGWEEEKDINSIYYQLEKSRQEKVYSYAEQQLEEQNRTQTVVTLGKTAAGEPIEQGDIIEEEKEVSSVPSDADVALVVQGDSMEPDYKNGSVVFYKKQPQVENGELAVVHIKDDGITFKRLLYDYDNQKIILRSLNDKYEDQVFEENQITVLGKVIN